MPPLTYANYLDLEKLLTLQNPRSTPAEHDEMLFIIIHQTYELWFKQLLHEFEKIECDFSAGDLFGAIHSFKRTRTIMKTLVGQIDILETMTPSSFSSFRMARTTTTRSLLDVPPLLLQANSTPLFYFLSAFWFLLSPADRATAGQLNSNLNLCH